VFTGNPAAYTGKSKRATSMINESGTAIKEDSLIVKPSVPFFMINKNYPQPGGGYDTLDVVIHDLNMNQQFDLVGDKVLFGALTDKGKWLYTVYIVEFLEPPQSGDVYFATTLRPFGATDSLTFEVLPQGALNTADIVSQMERIKVVPNPYVATNAMEPVVGNWYLNQRRRLLFTHLPSKCTIKIFTISGVLVDEIDVNNPDADGTAHWDVRSSEGLEVAAGMYLYHVQAKETKAEKIGKFAIIK
jgi:hypothetical protein